MFLDPATSDLQTLYATTNVINKVHTGRSIGSGQQYWKNVGPEYDIHGSPVLTGSQMYVA